MSAAPFVVEQGRDARGAFVQFTIPYRTKNPSNMQRGNTRLAAIVRSRQDRAARDLARMLCVTALQQARRSPASLVPCEVTLRRLSAGKMDDDGLATSCKRLRDGIADALGVNDGGPFVRWHYEQGKCRAGSFGVEVTIRHTPGGFGAAQPR